MDVTVTANEKRWIVAGTAFNKVVVSNLRPLVQDGLEKEYENLKKNPYFIHTQTHPHYLKTWPGGTGRNFKYENINGNDVYRVVGRKFALARFDFKVKSEVELAYLCLESHMAKFTSFNDECDGSAILSLLESAPSFVTPVKDAAKTVRQDVRNEWAHCTFIDWDESKFQDCFRDMKRLLKAAGLTAAEHDLDDWESKGIDLVKNSTNEQELHALVLDMNQLLHKQLISAKEQSDTKCIIKELSRFQEVLESRYQDLEKRVQIVEEKLPDAKNHSVKKFIQNLKRMYTSEEAHIAPLPWMDDADFTLDKMYTPLLISQVNKGKETNIDIQEVFKSNEMGKTVNILLEGSPGAGKTTFCRKLAYDWAEGKVPGSFRECEMFLFLKCRHVKDGCIWKAIEEQLLPEETTEKEREEIFAYIKSNQEKVLLIFDGYDEIPNAAESESIKESVTKVIRKKALPLCCTLVTSRQSKSHGMIQKYFQRLLKIKGIASYEDYITSFFDDSPNSELLEHIKLNPNLCELASNALNVALLCLVYKENSTKPIQWKEFTLSELYYEIIFCITKRFCKKTNIEVVHDKLMETFRPQHISLGRFAFNNLIKNQTTFSAELSEELESLGFLRKEKSGTVLRHVEGGVYAFAHKSIQDYFAALYLADRLRQGEGDDAFRLTDFEVFEAVNRYDLASMIGSDRVSDVSKYLALQMSSSCANDVPQPVLILICECLSECSHLPDFRQTLESVYHHIPAKVDFRVPIDCRRKALSGLCCLMSYKSTENLASEAGHHVTFPQDVLEQGEEDSQKTTPLNKLTLENLQCNDLNPECGEALANNTTAVSSRMIFSDCLGEEDHRSVCKVLRTNTSMQSFEVRGRSMSDESVCSIMDSLSGNSTIQEFTIGNHDPDMGIFYPHIRAIFACLLVFSVLKFLLYGYSSWTWTIVFDPVAIIAAIVVFGFTGKGQAIRDVLLGILFACMIDVHTAIFCLALLLFAIDIAVVHEWTIEYIGVAFILLVVIGIVINILFMKVAIQVTGKFRITVIDAIRCLVVLLVAVLTIVEHHWIITEHIWLAFIVIDNTGFILHNYILPMMVYPPEDIICSSDTTVGRVLYVIYPPLVTALIAYIVVTISSVLGLIFLFREIVVLSNMFVQRTLHTGTSRAIVMKAIRYLNSLVFFYYATIRLIGPYHWAIGIPLIFVLDCLLYVTRIAINMSMKYTIHNGKFGARVVEALSRMLRKNTQLRHLHLKSNKIGNDLACTLGEVLAQSKTLETLELDQGCIGDSGARGLARGLAQNSTLKSFTLRGLKDATRIMLAYQVKVLTWAMFGNTNKILCSPGACAIIEALERNHVIAHLDLSRNLIGGEGAKAIGQMLTTHKTLKTLRIGGNLIGVAGTVLIADGLSKNTGLEELDISFNGAKDEGICKIANAVVYHNTLKVLDITRNDIGVVGAEAVVDACAMSNTLTELHHEDNPILEECSVFCRNNLVQDALSLLTHDTEYFESLSSKMLSVYLLDLVQGFRNEVDMEDMEDVFHEDGRALLLAWQEWHYSQYLIKN